MGSNWATVSIDDIKSPEKYSCVGGPFGSSLSQKHYVDSGVPVIRGTNLAGDIFSESGFVFVSPDKANELQRNLAFRGDIVFTQRGTLGQVALIPEDSIYERYIVSQSQMKLTVNPKQADAYFIYTYFRTNEAKALIENNAIVGGVPHINLGILKEFKLRLPPLSEQKRISEVSKSIDNKINLNRQINQTLEQMSQTLFKSWFVDFDPVIDNALDAGHPIPEALQSRAELRQKVRNSADFKPLPADIRALFPAEFEETEMGWVPKGWMLESVAKSININPGVKLPQNTVAKYVDMKSLPTQGYSISDVIEKPYAGGAKFQKNDTLFARITPCLENGKTGFVDFLDEKETAFGSTEFIVMRGTTKVHYSYVACLARENNFRSHAIQNMVGSSGRQRVQNSCFDSFYISIPTPSVMSLFAGKVSSYFDKMYSCNLENKYLTALRDTLLPKLISGELSLEDLPNLVNQTEPA
ncbi:restriction endonuclease subunit S [Klebsiella pasteurii]|uniref:restriction endonuclease subunit S n=1 Tax=Klebsiella pasteurii TaxID=2587529 RepID=UPI00287CFA3A|nr:restriction endonuclease subunit S [Klebsiella pasteurii]MDS7907527.1 restriction endonuclease subunit S [Klebsiella pasteurii]MDV0997183.1 restriction endonuclease subunit S [Klebsiella pasteurii]